MTSAKKEIIVTILVAIIVICGIWFNNSHQVTYQVKGTCVERFTVGDEHGNANYKVIIKYDDGAVETLNLNAESYINYQVGKAYIYDRTKFQW